MKRIDAGRFKKRCLTILDRLDSDGLLITRRGKPVATLVPVGSATANRIGSLKGKIKIKGDILGTAASWKAARKRAS